MVVWRAEYLAVQTAECLVVYLAGRSVEPMVEHLVGSKAEYLVECLVECLVAQTAVPKVVHLAV